MTLICNNVPSGICEVLFLLNMCEICVFCLFGNASDAHTEMELYTVVSRIQIISATLGHDCGECRRKG